MATNRDLLREAIADAKAVKETAIANAKAALTESFTPFLKEKLSQKISEMEEGYMDEDANENMHADDNNEGLDEISLDELLAELEESPKMEENLYEAKKDEEKDEKDEEMSLEDMSEDDLKSFIEDVIKDMVANKELEAGHEGMEDEEGDEEGDEEMDEPTDEEPTDETADETADEPADEEEVDLEELLAEMNDDPKEAIEEEASLIYATTTEAIAAISAILAGVSGIALATWKDELKNAAKDGVKAMKEKVKSLLNNGKNSSKEEDTKDLEEAYSTVKTLQSELNEINLLNAKLLYTNKIFRSKSLTESQKIKVLTAFDKAKTKKEAQLVYETLTEGLKVSITKTSIKESLGSASKSLGIAIKKPIIENDAFARMRELAGLKK